MDVDPPPTSSVASAAMQSITSTLKRSSSAPMINVLGNTTPTREISFAPLLVNIPRSRRFSASCSPCHSPSSSVSAIPSRVSQIKHEEGMDVMIRETAHEKELQARLAISQSWDDLSLADGVMGTEGNSAQGVTLTARPQARLRSSSLHDPLHVFTPPTSQCGSPSPTFMGSGRQCFSPSIGRRVQPPFSLSPSPSPTRKTATRRSQSPITLRPSQFGQSVKRKFNMECMEEESSGNVTPKRLMLSLDHDHGNNSSSAPQSPASVGSPTPMMMMSNSGSAAAVVSAINALSTTPMSIDTGSAPASSENSMSPYCFNSSDDDAVTAHAQKRTSANGGEQRMEDA